MGVRLVPKTHVDRWEAELRAGVEKALDEMAGNVHAVLRMHGAAPPVALVAAGKKKAAVGIGTGIVVWNAAKWAAAVNTHIAPVAAKVGAAAVATASAAVPGQASWGAPGSANAIAANLTNQAQASGAYLGDRMNGDVATSTDPSKAVAAVLLTAGAIVGGVLGSAALGAANQASVEAASPLDGVTKTWAAVGDDRTREAHAEADGQEVDITDTFDVDGEALAYPGDPSGSDENVINCRCWCEFGSVGTTSADDAQTWFNPSVEG